MVAWTSGVLTNSYINGSTSAGMALGNTIILKIALCYFFVVTLPKPQLLATTNLISVPIVLSFPEFHRNGTFWIWLPPLNKCVSHSSLMLCE